MIEIHPRYLADSTEVDGITKVFSQIIRAINDDELAKLLISKEFKGYIWQVIVPARLENWALDILAGEASNPDDLEVTDVNE